MQTINDLFNAKPSQWGLRGDPYLWKELRNSLMEIESPLSQAAFEEALEHQFYHFIERHGKQTSEDIIWFEHFPQSGMSGGLISLKWWQETGLPFLKNRFRELEQ